MATGGTRSPQSLRSSLAATRSILRGHGVRIGVLAGTAVLSGICQALTLVILVRVSVALSRGESVADLSVGPFHEVLRVRVLLLIGIALVVALFGTALSTARSTAKMSTHVLLDLRSRLIGAFLFASPRNQLGFGVGQFIESLSSQTAQGAQVALRSMTVLVAGLNLLVLLGTAVALDPAAALAIVFATCVLSLLGQPLGRRRRRYAAENAAAGVAYADTLSEIYSAAREIRIYGVEDRMNERVTAAAQRAAKPYYGLNVLNRFVPSAFQYAGFGLLLIALTVASGLDRNLFAELGAILLLILRSFAYIQNLQVGIHGVGEAAPYLQRLLAVEQSLLESSSGAQVAATSPAIDIESLEIVAGSFGYSSDRTVLDKISLSLHRGGAVAIVGPSGSGKSTMAQVLMRLIDLDDGALFANGKPAESISLGAWYASVAYVPQDSTLVAGSIAENIAFFRDGITRQQVERSAKLAGIDTEINQMPGGYDTVLQHRGAGLSGGQRQRICIARALAGQPQVLILDEPTASLDPISTRSVVDTLSRLKKEHALLIITHHMQNLHFCDEVVLLQNGRTVSVGSSERSEAGYADLWATINDRGSP
jgi:ATP-binding cassette subfamily B protein